MKAKRNRNSESKPLATACREGRKNKTSAGSPLSPELQALAKEFQRIEGESLLQRGKILLQAKEAHEHGQWLLFLKTIAVKPRKAQDLMRIARSPRAEKLH